MANKENEKIIQEKIDGLLKNPPGYELSGARRTELISRVYNVSEERKHIVEFVPVKRALFLRGAACVLSLILLAVGLNYLFSPLYPTVANVRGTVKICRSSGNVWIFAGNKNIRLGKNDILKTFGDGQADLIIPRLYHMRLKNNSEVKLARAPSRALSGDIGYVLAQGKIFTHYSKRRKAGREFGIKTPQADVTALGTAFMVELMPVMNSTTVGVLDGAVKVGSLNVPEEAVNTVLVRAGERTVVRQGAAPSKPARLMENELLEMEELYNIGARPQVALLISTGPTRTRELLSLVPLYISSERPGILPEKIERLAKKYSRAIREDSVTKHMESIKGFEDIVNSYPNPKYDVQFLLFIGAYYNYVDEGEKAIATFERIIRDYPKSALASIAQCAIGIIYEEKLKDSDKARDAYQKILSDYPNSPEAEEASAGLVRLTG
jgi:tetratricopeptide (TPR) repeat protein